MNVPARTTRIEQIENLIEHRKISSLKRVEIDPVESCGILDGAANTRSMRDTYQVTIYFRATSVSLEGALLVVVERFASESMAMEYVLCVFESMVNGGMANRADIAPWRRALIVPVNSTRTRK